VRHGHSIGRADLATFMLDAVDAAETVEHTIGIAY
jgi:hypothetical protein